MRSMTTTKPNILITGVAGFIGSHLAEHLLANGYKVYGIDNLSGGYLENIPKEVIFSCGELEDKKWVRRYFAKRKIDYVYHLAAYAAEGLSPFIRNFNYSNNLLSSANLINECINRDVKKIIFTSSMAVYGTGNPPFTEYQQPLPEDPYGISKYAVELDLHQAKKQFGLDYSIVRPHNVIGTRQNIWDKYRNVVGIWVRNILLGENLTIFGDGEQERAFSDIRFYMEPLESLMVRGSGQVFNMGSDKVHTLNELAELFTEVATEFQFKTEVKHEEARHEVKHAYCNHDKAKNYLDFRDETNLKKTICEMMIWAMKQEDRPVKTMEYEVSKGIYNYWK